MNQYELEAFMQKAGENFLKLNFLLESNILKEMWNLLSIEEKREFAKIVVGKLSAEFSVRTLSGTIPYDNLFSLIDKDSLVKNMFDRNKEELIKAIEDATLIKIKSLINKIDNDSVISSLILPEIHKAVKNCYQKILSYHGDDILKETKSYIMKVIADESIIKYGYELMKKAKKLVDEELIKDQLE